MAGSLNFFYSPRVGQLWEAAMFVGLGFVMMMLATYGLFAWQLSLERIVTLCVAGVLLMAAQFLRVQKDAEGALEGEGSETGYRRVKGESDGR
jgi:hypothetical protein